MKPTITFNNLLTCDIKYEANKDLLHVSLSIKPTIWAESNFAMCIVIFLEGDLVYSFPVANTIFIRINEH